MTTVRRAIAFSFFESYLGIAINLVSFVLLARLLTPAQVGLFSVAIALISITQVIRDFGLVNFLIQKKDLTEKYIATAWGMALILGAALFILIQLAAAWIGDFYEEESLTTIARIVALNFLILPFNSICLALLRRAMNFNSVMRINLSAAVLSTAATLVMAWMGAGAYALAFGAVINNLIVALGILYVGAAARLLMPSLEKWREILSFGGPLTVANVITSISIDINDLAVGKIMGLESVAIVSRAQGLMNLFHRDFMGAIRNVALPALSSVNRSGGPVEAKFIASVTNVTVVAWTFYGFAALFPLELLRLMFGPQWDMSAPLVPIFCLAGAASALNSLVPTVMLATGHSGIVATAELILQPIKAVGLSIVIYYYRDLEVFSLGFTCVAMVSVPYWYALKQRYLPTDFAALGMKSARNLLLVGITLAPSVMVVCLLRPAGGTVGHALFFACAAVTSFAWLVLLWAFKHPLYHEFHDVIMRRLAPNK